MSGGYGGTVICAKSTANLPVFFNMGWGYAYTTRRIYYNDNNTIVFDVGWLCYSTNGSQDNGIIIPKYIYGVKI